MWRGERWGEEEDDDKWDPHVNDRKIKCNGIYVYVYICSCTRVVFIRIPWCIGVQPTIAMAWFKINEL
jgi:hypothetical protein